MDLFRMAQPRSNRRIVIYLEEFLHIKVVLRARRTVMFQKEVGSCNVLPLLPFNIRITLSSPSGGQREKGIHISFLQMTRKLKNDVL